MSLTIWPPISPEELKLKEAETLRNELAWITDETLDVCRDLKHGLEDCYALLAPIDPGSTLVMSTPRNEKVKGTITRVGTRIVKGTLNLQLRTTSTASLTIAPNLPIYIPALDALNKHLTEAVRLLEVLLSQAPDAATLASTLAILAESLEQASALLKGRPLTESDPTWQTGSCPSQHFTNAASAGGSGGSTSNSAVSAFAASFTVGSGSSGGGGGGGSGSGGGGGGGTSNPISFHISIQESCVVLWLRVLEPANAPVHFGVKLGLAIGTMRRLEHDEMDTVFRYHAAGDGSTFGHKKGGASGSSSSNGGGPVLSGTRTGNDKAHVGEEVHVREKVRVVSADPSLISLYSKLGFLYHVLGQARRNLAAVLESFPQD